MIEKSTKEGMHPRNRFREGYDFRRLVAFHPPLAGFVASNAFGDASIDYANPAAVKALNQALLIQAYGLRGWDVPPRYLCPPIPGRSDYLHHLADLLGGGRGSELPRGPSVAILDVGVGASCIYPLIGAREYGWRFVGSEVDPSALGWAGKLASAIDGVSIECRLQASRAECFEGVIRPGEYFEASMCNPPFHASAAEALKGTDRKQRNLGTAKGVSNFGGCANELWCPGGELGFILRMIAQSTRVSEQCRWFTTLVSKSAHLPRLREALGDTTATEVRTIEMAQGQKRSRILAWTFTGETAARPIRASRRPVR